MNSLQEALDRVIQRGLQDGTTEYLEACACLVDHREQLSQRVYILLPGDFSFDLGPLLQKIKEGSEARCDCGDERVIYPLHLREEFQKNDEQPFFILDAAHPTCYLKPVGSFKAATYCKLTLDAEAQAIEIVNDPFAPAVMSADLFQRKGFLLSQLQPALAKQAPAPGVYVMSRVPVVGFYNVETGSDPSVTIAPDKDVELLTEEPPNDGHVDCGGVAILL